jgi:hypothetical protein
MMRAFGCARGEEGRRYSSLRKGEARLHFPGPQDIGSLSPPTRMLALLCLLDPFETPSSIWPLIRGPRIMHKVRSRRNDPQVAYRAFKVSAEQKDLTSAWKILHECG